MLVQDVINTARYGELAGTAIKENTDVIILFINAGMTELYKRFPLSTKEYIIPLQEGVTIYDLPTDYMYIVSAYEEVEDTNVGSVQSIPINDENSDRSIFFPNHKQVQVPLVSDDAYISIIYVAKPTYYTLDNLGEDIDLPDVLLECLFNYIGYKAHVGIRSDGQSENMAHYARFEKSCKKAYELGVSHPIDSLRAAERLFDRGFV